jgi:hypothetical protein
MDRLAMEKLVFILLVKSEGLLEKSLISGLSISGIRVFGERTI